MAQFIEPIVNTALSVLQARTPALLAAAGLGAFRDFGREFTGVTVNFPGVYVMPGKTQFDPEGTLRHQLHTLTIKFAVEGMTPEAIATAAIGYMKAIDDALTASDPDDWADALAGGEVGRIFVQTHDYGPLYQRGQVMARFPELALLVETQEV